jgi:hypothetical protein
VRYGSQVIGVDAVSNKADVIDLKSFSDFSLEVMEGYSMSKETLACYAEYSISACVDIGFPDPAFSRQFYFTHKSRELFFCHHHFISRCFY